MSAPPRRDLAFLAIAAADVLAFTALTRFWFTGHPAWSGNLADVSMGLWGIEVCQFGCHGVRWDNVPSAEIDVIASGYLGVATAVLGAILTIVAAVGVLGRKPASTKAARTVLLVAIGAMSYFLLRNLIDDGWLDPSPSWGGFVAIGAAIGAHTALRRLE